MSGHTSAGTLDLVVGATAEVADNVVELRLRSAHGDDLPPWRPGAHIDLHLSSGLVRQYSLSGDPGAANEWRCAVLLEQQGRGGSREVHGLRSGDRVSVGGPRNHFELQLDRPRLLFIAGGIGITPLLPMIREAEAANIQWTLLYGGRTRSSMAYADDLERRYGRDRVRVLPQDDDGLLPLADWLGTPREDTGVYVCGPEPLLRAVETCMLPWPQDALHLERFAPKEPDPDACDAAFEVELACSQMTLNIPQDRTILDVLEEADVDLDYSCRDGTCGTCETRVLAGEPDHRDSVLSPAEQASGEIMMVCVSRARGPRLTLEL